MLLRADQRLKQKHKDVFLPAHPQKLYLLGRRTWNDIETQDYSPTDFSVSKKLINLLRRGSVLREDDGAIEFWIIKGYLQKYFLHCTHWSDDKWRKSWQEEEEETRKDFSIVLGTKLYGFFLKSHVVQRAKQGSKVLSNAIERHHPLQYTPSLLYPEGYEDGNWRNHIRKSI